MLSELSLQLKWLNAFEFLFQGNVDADIFVETFRSHRGMALVEGEGGL